MLRCRHAAGRREAAKDQLAAAGAGAGADDDDPVRCADDRPIVLDDEHQVAVVAQALEHDDEVIDVARTEARPDVDEIDEVPVELPGHLPAGSRRRTASARRA